METNFYTPPLKPKQTSRNSTIDLIRILTAFGVVYIHVHTSTIAAEAFAKFFLKLCVPFFFATSLVYLTQGFYVDVTIKTIISKIWKRICVPFLSWTVIYLSLRAGKYILMGNSYKFTPNLLIRAFLYGESSEQMYYLPELIITQFIVLGIFLIVTRKNREIGVCLLIFSISYLFWGSSHNYYGITPLSNSLFYIITAFYLIPTSRSNATKWVGIIIGLILVVIVAFTGTSYRLPLIPTVITDLPIGGLGLLLIGINTSDIQLPIWIKTIGLTTYGIYLSHVVFLEFLESIFDKLKITIFYDFPAKIAISLFVFIMSMCFTLLIKRIELLRIILLGEK